jgi:outer membrane protein assembly factor BamB
MPRAGLQSSIRAGSSSRRSYTRHAIVRITTAVFALAARSPLFAAGAGGEIESSPAIANGVLYFSSLDGNLYAYALPAAAAPIR